VNWTIFYATFVIAFLMSSPAFALLNALGVKLGQVPAPGAKTWHGRLFVHWREETTAFVADPFFLSLNAALVASTMSQMEWTTIRIVWVLTLSTISIIGTGLWLKSIPAAEKAGKLRTWGWHWCGPNARTSIGGYWHAIYFMVQATAGTIALGFLFWQGEVSIHCKMGMLFASAGYLTSLVHHNHVEKARGHN